MRNVFKDIRVNDAKTLLTIDESKIPAELQGTRDELRKMVAEDKANLQNHSHERIKRTVPRDAFVRHFLPFFAGLITDNVESRQRKWLDIAGSMFMEVSVVNERLETIATVPMLQRSDVFAPKLGKNKRIDQSLVMISNLQMARSGVYANAQEDILLRATENILDPGANDGSDKEWEALFTYFRDDLIAFMKNNGINENGEKVTQPVVFEETKTNEKPVQTYRIADDPDVQWDDDF
jgi:hypothetical protein